MNENNREVFYFNCWMNLKAMCPHINGLMRDLELKVGNFPAAKLLPTEKAEKKEATIQKEENVEEIM
jgi:hypothetical protein